MKKRIPTGIGLAIIFFLAAVVLFAWKNLYQSIAEIENDSIQTQIFMTKNKECKPRAFTGEAKIKGWYVTEDSEKLFQVAKENIGQLPVTNGDPQYGEKDSKLKLVDITPEMEKKLVKSSEENPQSITIKGYALPCEGNRAFASLDYKDGIFKSLLGLNNQ
jgi:hypothetical protein